MSCKEKQPIEIFLKKKELKYDQLVLIPNEGCTGCISDASTYFIKNLNENHKTLIIYTKINDLKVFKLRFPEYFLKLKNVIIDSTNFLSNDRELVYPEFYTLKSNTIETKEILQRKHYQLTIK